jgi:hypothetical protein
MNGAELPNGSVLRVEPAVGSKNSIDQDPSLPTEALTSEPVPGKEEAPNVSLPQELGKSDDPNESDDLDEFFESL